MSREYEHRRLICAASMLRPIGLAMMERGGEQVVKTKDRKSYLEWARGKEIVDFADRISASSPPFWKGLSDE